MEMTMSIGFLALKKFTTEFEIFRTTSASRIEDTASFFLECHTRAPEDIDGLIEQYLSQLQTMLVKRLVRGVRHEPGIRELAASAAKDWIQSNIICKTLETKVTAAMWTESFYSNALEKKFLESQNQA